MKDKKDIHKVLKSTLNLAFKIKPLSPSPDLVEKRLFIDILTAMVEIQDRSEFMISELGMDLVAYEDKYYRVIEGLFNLYFNTQQLSLIQMYLYELTPDKSWDGKIELDLQQGDEPKMVEFKTPKDVWEIIKKFKK
jgi:hypothetical protein